ALRLGARVAKRRAARDVVEHQDRARSEQEGIGRQRPANGKTLEPPGRAVGDRTDESTGERQGRLVVGESRGPRKRGAKLIEKGGGRRGRRGIARRGCDEADLFSIAEAPERGSSGTLPALHAFQQEPGAQRRQLEERRDRRVEIGRDVERLEVHVSSEAQKTKKPTSLAGSGPVRIVLRKDSSPSPPPGGSCTNTRRNGPRSSSRLT